MVPHKRLLEVLADKTVFPQQAKASRVWLERGMLTVQQQP
jgi:hypothetical protein